MNNGVGSTGNVIAALANVLFPGLGYLIQGRILHAVVAFIVISIGYALWFFVLPLIFAAIVHVFVVYDAATFSPHPV